MGYEMGFVSESHDWDAYNTDDVYWFACGWSQLDLCRAIAGLEGVVKKSGDEDDLYIVPVASLEFISDIMHDVKEQALYQVLYAVDSLDTSYAQEMIDEFPASVKVAMELPFTKGDISTLEVRQFLKDCMFDGRMWLPDSLAESIDTMKANGIEHVIMYGG